MRIAGYPEYDLPLPGGGIVQADGLRADDGSIVEAKYVQNPKSTCRTDTTLSDADATMGRPWVESMLNQDRDEMSRYTSAMQNANGTIRQVEIHTNYPPSVAYWDILMLENHTPGYTLYTP